jgi:NifB/MoaA-like Fe-S oxidoreductase
MRALADEVSAETGVQIEVHALENSFFGPRVNVSGLLVADDIERELRGRELGEVCLLPRYALDYTGHRFLDDRTPAELEASLGVPLAFASTMSEVLQILGQPIESQQTPGSAHRSNGKSWVDWQLEAPALGGRGLAKEARR